MTKGRRGVFVLLCCLTLSWNQQHLTIAQVVPGTPGIQVQNIGGNNFQVTTSVVNGRFALNSFNQFTIPNATVVNFILPPGVGVLINKVAPAAPSIINGTMNLRIGTAAGPIGGNLIHISPGGINIGNNGFVNVGSGLFLTSSLTNATTVTGGTLDLNTVTPAEFLDANNEIDPAIHINATSQPNSLIQNNGVISANLVSNDASGGLNFNQLGFASERFINNGVIQFSNIDAAGNPAGFINDGGFLTILGSGESTFNLTSNDFSTVSGASATFSNNGTVINNGSLVSPSGVISITSHADTNAGNENLVVNTGLVSTNASIVDHPGGQIFITTIGHSDNSATGGTINHTGDISADGLGGGEGGTVAFIANHMVSGPGSVISVVPGATGLRGGEVSFDRQTPGAVDVGTDSGNNNLVLSNEILNSIGTASAISLNGTIQVGTSGANVNTITMNDAATPFNTNLSIEEENTTNIMGTNNLNGLNIQSRNGVINVNGNLNLNTNIHQDDFLTNPALNLEANTLTISPGSTITVNNTDPSVSGVVSFIADNLFANNVNINSSTTQPGSLGGGLKIGKRSNPSPISISANDADFNGDFMPDITFNNIHLTGDNGNTGGTFIIENNEAHAPIDIFERPQGLNNTFGPGSHFIFNTDILAGTDALNFTGPSDFADSQVFINTGQGNVSVLDSVDFSTVSMNTGNGNVDITDPQNGLNVINNLDFGGNTFMTNIQGNGEIFSEGNGPVHLTGNFNNLSINQSAGSTMNIFDTGGNLTLNNISASHNLNVSVLEGNLNLNGGGIGIDTDNRAHFTVHKNGMINVNTDVSSTNGSLEFSAPKSSTHSILITDNGFLSSALDILINRGNTKTLGNLGIVMNGDISSDSSIIIGSSRNTSSVTIAGTQSGLLGQKSPFTQSTLIQGPTAGFDAQNIQINVLTSPGGDDVLGGSGGNNPLFGPTPPNILQGNNSFLLNPVDFFLDNRPGLDQGLTGLFPQTGQDVLLGPPLGSDFIPSFVDNNPPLINQDTLLGGPDPNAFMSQLFTTGDDSFNLEDTLGAYFAKKIENRNDFQYEFDADKIGILYSYLVGYHPRGLESFLNLISFYEKKSSKHFRQGEKNISSAFSYRHPETDARIENVKEEAEKGFDSDTHPDLTNPIVNTKEFSGILKQVKSNH